VLADSLSITLPDPDHSESEERLLVLGQSRFGRLLILSITLRADVVRIINARPMSSRERRTCEHEIGR